MFKFIRFIGIFICAVTVVGGSANHAKAEHTRVTNPNAIALEVGGRTLLWSLNVDRVLSDDWVIGVGFGSVGTNLIGDSSSSAAAKIIPFYLNYYLAADASSLYLTAGVNMITNSSSLVGLSSSTGNAIFSSSSIMGTAGLGYEYRSDTGFLVRAAAYILIANNISPWAGVSFGYSF